MQQKAILPIKAAGLCRPAQCVRATLPCAAARPARLAPPGCRPQERPQYLYHFVLHAALDVVEEQEWRTTAMHLGVVDRFNNLQVGRPGGGAAGAFGASKLLWVLARSAVETCATSAWLGAPQACVRCSCRPFEPAWHGAWPLTQPRTPHLQVSAFTTAARTKFLLLHDGRSDDLVKSFFRDVYELYLRVCTCAS